MTGPDFTRAEREARRICDAMLGLMMVLIAVVAVGYAWMSL